MMSMSMPAPATTEAIDDREARDMALFLVRVFGDDAAAVVAERSENSEQKADWRRVGGEVEKLLSDEVVRMDPQPLRLIG
jgi:hypothetical protein